MIRLKKRIEIGNYTIGTLIHTCIHMCVYKRYRYTFTNDKCIDVCKTIYSVIADAFKYYRLCPASFFFCVKMQTHVTGSNSLHVQELHSRRNSIAC